MTIFISVQLFPNRAKGLIPLFMKILFTLCLLTPLLASAVDWSNPRVRCPEEVLPQGFACPDLSQVENVFNDFPADMPEAERDTWRLRRASDLKLCQHREVLRRESVRAGSFTPLQVQIAWMVTQGGEQAPEKLAAVMEAARRTRMPPHVLLGAITQESLLANLGVSPDGGNYSCGIAQLNISEWCQGLMSLPATERARLGWPALSCAGVSSSLVAPFYAIARTRLNGRPAYRITASDFAGIALENVVSGFPPASEATQALRYQAVTSFIQNCQDVKLGIAFKAQVLRHLFDRHVPGALKRAETYPQGQTFARSCAEPYSSPYYPLHTGWLLAVAAYNAGPNVAKLVEHYYQVQGGVFPAMTPTDLIEALHWGGRHRPGTLRVYFEGQDGVTRSQPWYKSCVVQRHVARVVQHVSQAGVALAAPIELAPCTQNSVPAFRQNSSGVKEPTL